MWSDIRYAVRALRRAPGFTTVAVMALALGIGANTAIFSVVNAILLRSLPYHHPDRLVMIWGSNPNLDVGIRELPSSPADYDAIRKEKVFAHVTTYRDDQANLANGSEPWRVAGAKVADEFFQTFGVQPVLGRMFTTQDQDPGNARVVILSHALWTRAFGASPDVIGRKILVDEVEHEVVGVAPKGFTWPRGSELPPPYGFAQETELWRPIAFSPKQLATHFNRSYPITARLADGATLEQAEAALQSIHRSRSGVFPEWKDWGFWTLPFRDSIVGNVERLILIVSIAVGFVLLIACANVANLLLARAAGRSREIAVRVALGAGRAHIIRQIMAESLILASAGAMLGIFFAYWGITALLALAPDNIPRLQEASIDGTVLAFTVLLALVTAVLFGMAPALQSSRVGLNEALKEGTRGGTEASGRRRTRSVLTAVEVALAVMLLIGAGLLIRSFVSLYSVDPGFDGHSVLAFDIVVPDRKYHDAAKLTAFYDSFLAKLAARPGIASAGMINNVPLGGTESMDIFVTEGMSNPGRGKEPFGDDRRVSADYFRAVGTPLLSGRYFTGHDGPKSQPVVIVNETLARRYFPGGAVGRKLHRGRFDEPRPDWRVIVGVVADVKQSTLHAEPRPQFYTPFAQNPDNSMSIVVRTAGDPLEAASTVRSVLAELDPRQPIGNVRTMRQVIDDSVSRQRFTMVLLTLFAATATLLAVIGLYGVMAYTVAQRTREIGVRMALGARQDQVLRTVLGEGMLYVGAGAVAGLAGAVAIGRLMSSLLFGVSPSDPLTYASVCVLLLAVALIAAWLPARRASRVDPMVALRYE